MRRPLTVLTALVAVVLVPCLAPRSASAVPEAELCTPDDARGGVPAGFPLDACVDATSITVRNGLRVAVRVHRDGDLGAPVRVHERGSAAATVLRMVTAPDEVLMPGDVAWWPLGASAATLTVSDVEPLTAAIVRALDPYLSRPGAEDAGPESFRALATVVRDTAAAITARAGCVVGKNFLQAAACDVAAASAVSRAVAGQLPRRPATNLLASMLDPVQWADWVAPQDAGVAETARGNRVIAQAAVPVPVVVAPMEVPAPPPVAVPPPAAAVPAPAVVPPAPAVVPPAPVPAPVPVPPAPAVPTTRPEIPDWLAQILARLAAESAEKDSWDGNGNGNGRGGK
jgi:hypothetical protein